MTIRLAKTREKLRERSDALLAPLARRLAAYGVTANHVTVAGTLLVIPAALFAANGNDAAAGALFLVASSFDMFDGTLARAGGKASPFGALLDSTLDRVGEALLLAALGWRFAAQSDELMTVVVIAALAGGFLTSYVRARAEGLGIECRAGWFTRPERVVVLGGGLLLGYPRGALVLLAALSLFTVAQRMKDARGGFSRMR